MKFCCVWLITPIVFLPPDWLFSFCRVPEPELLRYPAFPVGREPDEVRYIWDTFELKYV